MQHIQFPARPEDDENLANIRKVLGDYWSEGEAYLISRSQVAQLNKAAADISRLFKEGIDHVLQKPELLSKFVFSEDAATNENLHSLIKKSWRTNPSYVLDRWDMAWDGAHPPQILERNIGWVGLLAASGMIQEEYGNWVTTQDKQGKIYDGRLNNESMEMPIIKAFKQVAHECNVPPGSSIITFAEEHDFDDEMFMSGIFLNECVKQAGYESIIKSACPTYFEKGYAMRKDKGMPPLVVGHEKAQELKKMLEEFKLPELVEIFGGEMSFRNTYILTKTLVNIIEEHKDDPAYSFTLGSSEPPKPERFGGGIYPYSGFPEFVEMVGTYLKGNAGAELHSKTLIPYWTLLADHKGMLVVLHELFPQNPHVPATYWGTDALQGQKRIIKEALGCQGKNAVVFDANNEIMADRRRAGLVGKDYITQAYCDAVYDIEGRYKVVNLFTANDATVAIGTRVAPGTFVGGHGTHTRYVPVLVCE